MKKSSFNSHLLPSTTFNFLKYKKSEIIDAWSASKQNLKIGADKRKWCIVYPCDKEEAIILSALFIRHIFASPTNCHYDGENLFLYCGDAGSNTEILLEKTRQMILGYKLFGVDEYGELFELGGNLNSND